MYYERIVDKNELFKLLSEYNKEDKQEKELFQAKFHKFTQNDLKTGEDSLLKRFDSYCRAQMKDLYYNNYKGPLEDLFKSKMIGCLSISAPHFYNTHRRVKKLLVDRNKIEKDILNRCIVLENNGVDVKKCLKDKIATFREVIQYEIDLYNVELKQFLNDIYY
jgi:hypothetical protein